MPRPADHFYNDGNDDEDDDEVPGSPSESSEDDSGNESGSGETLENQLKVSNISLTPSVYSAPRLCRTHALHRHSKSGSL